MGIGAGMLNLLLNTKLDISVGSKVIILKEAFGIHDNQDRVGFVSSIYYEYSGQYYYSIEYVKNGRVCYTAALHENYIEKL